MKYALIDRLNEEQEKQLHRLYQNEWWTQGRTLPDVKRMLTYSDFVFGACDPSTQRLLGFARVLSDRVYKALIFDLIVASDHRHGGLGKVLMDAIFNHEALRGVRHFELYCLPEMEPFYAQWGFSSELGDLRLMRLQKR